jgi:hypothetical protein
VPEATRSQRGEGHAQDHRLPRRCAAIGVAAPLPAVEAAPRPARLRWHSCYSDVAPNLECATFRVPLDYDRPRGQKISLALIRIPAGDPERRIGSLFFNPGGPGTSGVDKVLGAAGSDDLP